MLFFSIALLFSYCLTCSSSFGYESPLKPKRPIITPLSAVEPSGDELEGFRERLEEYRNKVEIRREGLEKERTGGRIDRPAYDQGVKEYHEDIDHYRKGIKESRDKF